MKPWPHYVALGSELPVKALSLFSKSLFWILSFASEPHPLFSASAAAGVVAVLYLPSYLLLALISPVVLLTLFLLVTLLRLGSPVLPSPTPETDSNPAILPSNKLPEAEDALLSSSEKTVFCEPLVEWGGWRGPLEVIYEEYEEEEEENGESSPENSKLGWQGFEGLCYLDMEREQSLESLCSRSDVEGEDLIELVFDEDNMFEINLSACS